LVDKKYHLLLFTNFSTDKVLNLVTMDMYFLASDVCLYTFFFLQVVKNIMLENIENECTDLRVFIHVYTWF